MGAYRTFKEASLERQVADLEQELIKLKTPQRYAQKQIKGGYTSDTVSIQSWIQSQQSGYELRVIEATLEFVGNKELRQIIGALVMRLYNSSGQEIFPDFSGMDYTKPAVYEYTRYPSGDVNRFRFDVSLAVSGTQGGTDAFRGDFTVVANDKGILKRI